MAPTRLQMPLLERDFEKGGDAGLADSLSVRAAALETALEQGGRKCR